MEKKIIRVFFIILIFISYQFTNAQKSSKLIGKVVDNKSSLEFVDVILKRANDSTKVIKYLVTDAQGNYTIEDVTPGEYSLLFKLLGYKSYSKKITVPDNQSYTFVETIILKNDATLLNDVVVSTQKKLIKKTSEGFIVNTSTNIAQAGGTATDVLKNIPTISVDAEGAITMRGKKPMILINGKNSAITNIDQIAASSIESVEIINNPTAKYDANAESGLINIKLKKNNLSGTNGAVSLGTGFGSKGRINSALILNHKAGKWNFELGYDNRFAGRTKKINASRTNYFIADEHLLTQTRNDKRLEQLQNLNANIDFAPNEKNSFSLEIIGNMEGQDNNETLQSALTTKTNSFFSNNKRHSLELERSKVAEMALNYDRKFSDNRKSLTANITSSFNNDRENTNIDTYNYDVEHAIIGDIFLQKTHNYENENISNAKIDYTFPISEKTIIETGYKGTFRFYNANFQSEDNINNEYIINLAGTNTFKFNEQIDAIYGMLNSYISAKKNNAWKYNLGLRIEQVSNTGKTQNDNSKFKNNYIKFFPSTSLQYNLETNQYIKLSYNKRINRPELDQLNPFLDITDALNPHSGNPYLKPEIVNALELGYNKELRNYSFSANGFYRNETNTIKQYSELQNNGVVLLSPKNFGNTITFGLETIFSIKPTSIYDATISLTAFQQNINGSNVAEDVVSKAFNWYGKFVNNLIPCKGGKLQIIGSYNSKLATPQGNRIPIYSMDMGFQQKLGNGNSRLGLVVTDIFNTLKSGYANNTTNFTNRRTSKSDTRAIMLTFAYTFKSTFKEKLMENQFTPEY